MLSFELCIVGMSESVRGLSRGYSLLVNGRELWTWGFGYGVFSVRVYGYGFMCGKFGGRGFNWRWLWV